MNCLSACRAPRGGTVPVSLQAGRMSARPGSHMQPLHGQGCSPVARQAHHPELGQVAEECGRDGASEAAGARTVSAVGQCGARHGSWQTRLTSCCSCPAPSAQPAQPSGAAGCPPAAGRARCELNAAIACCWHHEDRSMQPSIAGSGGLSAAAWSKTSTQPGMARGARGST